MLGNDFAIYETVELSIAIFFYTANPPLALADPALMVTKIAAHLIFGACFIKHGFVHIPTSQSCDISETCI